MNAEAARLVEKRAAEAKALGGDAAYRLQALEHLKLKTVVKESHGTPVHSLSFNHISPDCDNLFATVGADQATIYDDAHMGDYVSVVVHFTNQATEHAEGGELQASCWINPQAWTAHPHGDACLAVSGPDPAISIISVVEACVVKLLKGHVKDVVDLSSAASKSNLLLSLSRDGNLRLWDVKTEVCLSSVTSDATCAALAPDGGSLVVGTSRGRLFSYRIGENGAGATVIIEDSKTEMKVASGAGHSEAIDCLRFLPGDRLATKSADGRMFVWRLPSMDSVAGWKVPGCNPMGGFSSRCQFNATKDGKYISVGNSSGSCYVFDADTGARVTAVSAIKVSAPVRSCALSEDCRHLVAAVGKGFVFRFEYLGTANALNEEDGGSEGSEGVENRDVNAPPAATGGGEAAGAAPAAGMDLDSVPAGP